MTEPVARKVGRPRDESLTARRREEILQTAGRVFARCGYANTDVQVVANELGVGKGTVYRYFPSKEDLFFAATDRGMQGLMDRIDAQEHAYPDPLDRFVYVIHTYLTYFDEHPELVELLTQERAVFKDQGKSVYFKHREQRVSKWQAIVHQLIREGRLREVPAHRVVDVIGNLMYGTMFTNYFMGRRKPFEEQAQDMLDIVFYGLLTEEEKKKAAKKKTVTIKHG